jgi:starch synthase
MGSKWKNRVKQMKVALLSFDFGEYCIRLANGIAQDPHTSVLLFLPDYEAEPYRHLLSKSVELRTFKNARLRNPIGQFLMVTRLVREIKKFNPGVIHLQIGHLWFNWALPLLGALPLVLTVHDALIHPGDVPSGKTPQWVFDHACYRAQERIVHAPQIKESLLQRLRIPSNTVHVVPYVLVGDDGATAGEKLPEGEPRILFFGRIWEYKGLEYLIRAEPLITSRVPQAKIVIAGRGEDFERYRRMMVHPEKFIVHNEYVSDDKRAELLRRASVVVLPYTEASQSGVIPIAYRFGKPVVATSVGGLPFMVNHGRTGYLVPPRDSNALADAVVSLLQNVDLGRQFGENGRRKVNVECAPEVVGEKTRAVYRRAMNGRLATS